MSKKLTTAFFILLVGPAFCSPALLAGDRIRAIDFTNDVAPILTKLGCNTGGCHGKATGRGGFKLSLFGQDAKWDFDAITRGSRGRRVFPAAADRSLMLQKATMAIPHGGGRRLAKSDPEYRIVKNWIESGLPWGSQDAARIVGLQVRPTNLNMSPDSAGRLTATAIYSDGSHRDVTRLTRFRSNNTSVATVDRWGRVATLKRSGETSLVAQFQGEVAVSRVAIPRQRITAAEQKQLDRFREVNFIDRGVVAKLRALKIPPSDLVDDATFLRRASLQIAGRLPTLSEVKRFLADMAVEKRARLVDRLLASGDYAEHFAQKWCDVLRIKRRGEKDRIPGTMAFHRWVRNFLAANRPYDRFVREIITAAGNVAVNPAAQWYAEVRYLDRYVDDSAQVFLGIRIGCARCHHHPFEKYSQEDYYGLAAFFARVDRKGGTGVAERRSNEAVFVKPAGSVKHPLSGKVVLPKGLGGKQLKIPPFQDPREHLVDWMVDPANPYLARAFVNRMWSHFFGRGLVDPMDDMRATNPASNEVLLNDLAAEFVRSKFNMKHMIRLICNSRTYQLSSAATEANLDDLTYHSRFYPQRLTAEVLLDAIDQATQVPTRFRGLPAGTRAVQLPDEGHSNQFLNLFGRPTRESACECERVSEPSLSQSLLLMNSAFMTAKLSSSKGSAVKLSTDKRQVDARVDELFQRVLCRRPTLREAKDARQYLASEADKKAAWGNLLWALVNTKEFLFVH